MFLGSRSRSSLKAWSARSRKPAFRKGEIRPREEPLVGLDGPLDLPFLAEEVAQHLEHLHGVGIVAGHLGQLADGQIRLARGGVVQALDVMGGVAVARTVAPLPAAQRGGPGAARGQARDARQQDRQQRGVGHDTL